MTRGKARLNERTKGGSVIGTDGKACQADVSFVVPTHQTPTPYKSSLLFMMKSCPVPNCITWVVVRHGHLMSSLAFKWAGFELLYEFTGQRLLPKQIKKKTREDNGSVWE
ncbi:hypothetical protein BgiBS90_024108 [Biomphalaria glabrata]|nr:hypothetical protein BgiBS90_024108 [Biomphalaria glabrata]